MRSKTWPSHQPPARKWDTFTLIHTNNTTSSWVRGCVLTLKIQNNVQPSAVFSCVQLCGCCGDERRCGHGKNGPGSHCPGSIIILGRIVQEHCICSILRLLSASGVLPSSELGTPVSNHHQTRWAFWERYKRGKRIRRRVYFIDYIVCITFSCVLSVLSN